MSKFREIKNNLRDIFNTNEAWYTKTGFSQIVAFDDQSFCQRLEAAIDLVVNEARQLVRDCRAERADGGCMILRKTSVIASLSRPEEILERILASTDDHLYNQLNLLSGILPGRQSTKDNIDLVRTNDQYPHKIIEMIELKEWDNEKDNPLSAALQLVFYYHIYKGLVIKINRLRDGSSPIEVSDKVKLTVLAPSEYYEGHFVRTRHSMPPENKVLGIIKDTIRQNINGVTFNFEKIEIKKQEVEGLMEKLQEIKKVYKTNLAIHRGTHEIGGN